MSERTVDQVKELIDQLNEEGFVGVLKLHSGPNKRWAAETERSIKAFDLPQNILDSFQVASECLPSVIEKVEFYRNGKNVDRIKITRKV